MDFWQILGLPWLQRRHLQSSPVASVPAPAAPAGGPTALAVFWGSLSSLTGADLLPVHFHWQSTWIWWPIAQVTTKVNKAPDHFMLPPGAVFVWFQRDLLVEDMVILNSEIGLYSTLPDLLTAAHVHKWILTRWLYYSTICALQSALEENETFDIAQMCLSMSEASRTCLMHWVISKSGAFCIASSCLNSTFQMLILIRF